MHKTLNHRTITIRILVRRRRAVVSGSLTRTIKRELELTFPDIIDPPLAILSGSTIWDSSSLAQLLFPASISHFGMRSGNFSTPLRPEQEEGGFSESCSRMPRLHPLALQTKTPLFVTVGVQIWISWVLACYDHSFMMNPQTSSGSCLEFPD